MAKDMILNVALGAKVASSFAQSFKNGKSIVSGFEKTIGKLNNELNDIDSFKRYSKAVDNVTRDIEKSKIKHAELAKQMAATENPTKKLRNEYERSAASLDKLTRKQDEYNRKLRETGAASKLSGLSAQQIDNRRALVQGDLEAAKNNQTRSERAARAGAFARNVANKAAFTGAVAAGGLLGGAMYASNVVQETRSYRISKNEAEKALGFDTRKASDRIKADKFEKLNNKIAIKYGIDPSEMYESITDLKKSNVNMEDINLAEQYLEVAALNKAAVGKESFTVADSVNSLLMTRKFNKNATMEDLAMDAGRTDLISDNVANVEAGDYVEAMSRLAPRYEGRQKQLSSIVVAGLEAGLAPEEVATGAGNIGQHLSKGAGMGKTQKAELAKIGVSSNEQLNQLQKDFYDDPVRTVQRVMNEASKHLNEEQVESFIRTVFGAEALKLVGAIKQTDASRNDKYFDDPGNATRIKEQYAAREGSTAAREARASSELAVSKNTMAEGLVDTYVDVQKEIANGMLEFSKWLAKNPTILKDMLTNIINIFKTVASGFSWVMGFFGNNNDRATDEQLLKRIEIADAVAALPEYERKMILGFNRNDHARGMFGTLSNFVDKMDNIPDHVKQLFKEGASDKDNENFFEDNYEDLQKRRTFHVKRLENRIAAEEEKIEKDVLEAAAVSGKTVKEHLNSISESGDVFVSEGQRRFKARSGIKQNNNDLLSGINKENGSAFVNIARYLLKNSDKLKQINLNGNIFENINITTKSEVTEKEAKEVFVRLYPQFQNLIQNEFDKIEEKKQSDYSYSGGGTQ